MLLGLTQPSLAFPEPLWSAFSRTIHMTEAMILVQTAPSSGAPREQAYAAWLVPDVPPSKLQMRLTKPWIDVLIRVCLTAALNLRTGVPMEKAAQGHSTTQPGGLALSPTPYSRVSIPWSFISRAMLAGVFPACTGGTVDEGLLSPAWGTACLNPQPAPKLSQQLLCTQPTNMLTSSCAQGAQMEKAYLAQPGGLALSPARYSRESAYPVSLTPRAMLAEGFPACTGGTDGEGLLSTAWRPGPEPCTLQQRGSKSCVLHVTFHACTLHVMCHAC